MKDKVINDLLSKISDLEFEVEKQDKEIERLKEEYMILQNASDEVEEEKDKEIERLNNIINELEKWVKFFNENGLVIDLEEGKQTTVMPTLAVIEKLQELKGSSDKE